jgi:hypothetical protein
MCVTEQRASFGFTRTPEPLYAQAWQLTLATRLMVRDQQPRAETSSHAAMSVRSCLEAVGHLMHGGFRVGSWQFLGYFSCEFSIDVLRLSCTRPAMPRHMPGRPSAKSQTSRWPAGIRELTLRVRPTPSKSLARTLARRRSVPDGLMNDLMPAHWSRAPTMIRPAQLRTKKFVTVSDRRNPCLSQFRWSPPDVGCGQAIMPDKRDVRPCPPGTRMWAPWTRSASAAESEAPICLQ